MTSNNNLVDDEFGSFEVAPSINFYQSNGGPHDKSNNSISLNSKFSQNVATINKNQNFGLAKQPEQLPDWLLKQTLNNSANTSPVKAKITSSSNSSSSSLDLSRRNADDMRRLEDELNKVKIDSSSSSRAHTDERFESHNASSDIHSNYYQNYLKEILARQRDTISQDVKELIEKQAIEQEAKFSRKLKEMQLKHDEELNKKLEEKLVVVQNSIIKHYESYFEELEMNVKKIVNNCLKDEEMSLNFKLKTNLEQIRKELKTDNEKFVQSFFKSQSETFKEQIKSGVQQEHLIHRDLINNKLEKLFKMSEEKRRSSNLLFTRHLSGLTFFLENAQKELGILNQAQQDLLKNKEIVDYYGNESGDNRESNNNNSKSSEKNSLLSIGSITDVLNSLSINSKSESHFKGSISSQDGGASGGSFIEDETLLQDLA